MPRPQRRCSPALAPESEGLAEYGAANQLLGETVEKRAMTHANLVDEQALDDAFAEMGVNVQC